MALLAEVSAALAQGGMLAGMLAQCAGAVVTYMEAAFARIWLLDEAAAEFVVAASAGDVAALANGPRRIPVGSLLIGPIALDRTPYFSHDVVSDPRAAAIRDCLSEAGLVAFAGHPLLVEGRVIGVIGYFSRQALLPDAGELLASIADTIAQGVERKRMEEALQASEAKLRAIVENSADPIYIKDREGRFLHMNPAGAASLGKQVDDIVGRTLDEVFGAEKARILRREDLEVLLSGRMRTYEHDLPGADGAHRTFQASKYPYFSAHGEALGTIGISRDITEHKRMQSALQSRNAMLEELEQLKSNLVNAVSHELRTPLTSIIGYMEFLEDHLESHADVAGQELIQPVKRSVARIHHLVDDLMDHARIQAGVFRLVVEETPLHEPINRALESMVPHIRAKTLQLEAYLPTAELLLPMDAERVEQVLLNLLSNAVKFTPEGGRLRISAQVEADAVRVEIADSGVGIPADKLGQVFEQFFQTGPEPRRARGGAGLGLAISKSLVEAHGGAIGAESTEGRGASFWFTLPRHRS